MPYNRTSTTVWFLSTTTDTYMVVTHLPIYFVDIWLVFNYVKVCSLSDMTTWPVQKTTTTKYLIENKLGNHLRTKAPAKTFPFWGQTFIDWFSFIHLKCNSSRSNVNVMKQKCHINGDIICQLSQIGKKDKLKLVT